MKKNELIHLHALLAEIRREVTPDDDTNSEAFREYERYGVGPNHIHYGKKKHEQAIHHLNRGLMQICADEERAADSRRLVTPPSRR